MNLDTQRGRDAHAHLKAGDVSGLSIGYQVPAGGHTRTAQGRLLKTVAIHEVSVTATPADTHARVVGVKTLQSKADLEEMLRSGGLSRSAARKLAGGGWAALAGQDEPEDDPALVLLSKRLDEALLDFKSLNKGR